MKALQKLLILLLVLTVYSPVRAECYYTNYIYKLKIIKADGTQLTAYEELSKCDLHADSLMNDSHLLRILKLNSSSQDVLFFHDLFKFKYCIEPTLSCPDSFKSMAYSFTNGFRIPKDSIVSIRVLERIEKESFTYLDTDIFPRDSSWILEVPLKRLDVYGYLCSSIILYFNEETDEQCTSVTKEIYAFQLRVENLEKEGWFEKNNGDNFDDQLNRLIADLRGCSQLVIISSCTD